MTSWPKLLIRTTSGSVVYPQSGSVLISTVHIVTKSHMDNWDLGCQRGPCRCLRAVLLPRPHRSEKPTLPPRAMVSSGPGLLALPQMRSVLISVVPVTTEDSEDGAAQSWPSPSLTPAVMLVPVPPSAPPKLTVGAGPAPHLGSTVEATSL